MRSFLVAALCAASIVAVSGQAEAKGCIKGAILGGIAGHMAHHGLMGAAAGCVVGHNLANRPKPAPKMDTAPTTTSAPSVPAQTQ